uniref:riboflavin kinase n=1 Tax=candidate division CPR3 bacterium TaxID=2268181 RepID=A0A7C4M3B7_UNCC3
MKWRKGEIVKGDKFGTKIGFPTLNIANPNVLKGKKHGVYASLLKIEKTFYYGILFFGPRFIHKEKKPVLEIHVFDFDKKIYGRTVYFRLVEYIRPPINFSNIDAFKKQLIMDCKKTRQILTRFLKQTSFDTI